MRADELAGGFSSRNAAELAGITFRQLDYWCRTKLIEPSIVTAHGSGTRRRWSVDDVRKLAVLGQVYDRQRPLVAEALRTSTCRRLVIDVHAEAVYCIENDEELIAAIRASKSVTLLDLDTIVPAFADA